MRSLVVLALLLLAAGSCRAAVDVGVNVNIEIDPVAIGNAITGAIASARERDACVKAIANEVFASTKLNTMVFNLNQDYSFSVSADDLAYYDTFSCDGVTFGAWAFCQGTFTNKGDGGYINWAFQGQWERSGSNNEVVTFSNMCTPKQNPNPESPSGCEGAALQPGTALQFVGSDSYTYVMNWGQDVRQYKPEEWGENYFSLGTFQGYDNGKTWYTGGSAEYCQGARSASVTFWCGNTSKFEITDMQETECVYNFLVSVPCFASS